jgi:hypothetical protein
MYRCCRIQDRWCPACGERFLARAQHPPRIFVGSGREEPRAAGPVGGLTSTLPRASGGSRAVS